MKLRPCILFFSVLFSLGLRAQYLGGVGDGAALVLFQGTANGAQVATQLAFTTAPSFATPAGSFSVVVEIRDAAGNQAAFSSLANGSVALAIDNNPASGTLSGSTPVTAVNAIATFSGMSINNGGFGYTLEATVSTLSATSAGFDVFCFTCGGSGDGGALGTYLNYSYNGSWSPENPDGLIASEKTVNIIYVESGTATLASATNANRVEISAGGALAATATLTTDSVIILSDASGYGMYKGNQQNVRIQQYVANAGWHNMALPVSGNLDQFGLVNTAINPNTQNIYAWDAVNGQWSDVVGAGNGSLVANVAGNGYNVYVGSNGVISAGAVVEAKGQMFMDATPSLHNYASIDPNIDDWNLIGNPLTCALDFTQLTLADVNNSFSIWEHAALDTIDARHTAPSGSKIEVPNDGANGVGAFIYRSAAGSGSTSWSDVGLSWKYGNNNLADGSYIEIKVFGIEMVYATSGSFAAGSGGNEDQAFTLTTINTATANTAPAGTGSLGGKAGGYPENQTAPNANWPNGYNAFYCMKYEMSQGQYRDFLNTLTRPQQNRRTGSNCAPGVTTITNRYVMTNKDTVLNRNVIRCDTVVDANLPIVFYCDLDRDAIGNESADGEWIACNWLNWMDACAYMDWAGLRPMTELEFEKACRGVATPNSNEYVVPSLSPASGLSNAGTSSESYGNTSPNSVYNNSTGSPYRVGVFSGASSSRNDAGAAYYGMMEMGGNVTEPTVTISNADGRAYTGLHGNGVLSDFGHANTANWPGLVSGELTAANGAGNRGGSYDAAQGDLRISERSFADNSATKRTKSYGCRAVRTAP